MESDWRCVWLASLLCWLAACSDDGGTEVVADPVRTSDGGTRDATVRGGKPTDRGGDDDALPDDDGDEERDAGARDRDGGAGDAAVALPDGQRLQDRRQFTIDPSSLPFFALSEPTVPTDRWAGQLEGAGYRIEVPSNWNGQLVMYAHDYQGVNAALSVRSPSLRRHLVEQGFAWAASSFTRNYYDVRAGVEDTNALALAFTRIAEENGRKLAVPTKIYVLGHAMGGHVAGAAVERETEQTARNKVHYHGALAMCGVMGDLELFRYFAAYQAAAHQLAGVPITRWPVADFQAVRGRLVTALYTSFPSLTTPLGDRLRTVVMNLSGGARPLFEQGFTSNEQANVWNAFAGDAWLFGVLRDPTVDTRAVVYQLDGDPSVNTDEMALNRTVFRVHAVSDDMLNPPRPDGLRWVPPVHGDFAVPVITLHTLGDVLVPFSMQQVYRRRALDKGRGELLVQRAIRAAGHCEFTLAEQIAAFDALVAWEQRGVKPDGDEVLDAAVVSAPTYGCKFTDHRTTLDDPPLLRNARASMPACAP
ncbi:MAG: alpha/beta hydrolase [Polyangiales bacterium]